METEKKEKTRACAVDDGACRIEAGSLLHEVLELYRSGWGKIAAVEAEKQGPVEEVRQKLATAGFLEGQQLTEKGYTALLKLQRCKELAERVGGESGL